MILFTLRELYLSANGDKWEVAEDDDKRLSSGIRQTRLLTANNQS